MTSVLREGARHLLAETIEAEAASFLTAMRNERLADGRARVVRHGHGPERTIQTGIGPVAVRRPKLRDRGADGEENGDRITFTSAILPKWARRTKSLDALLPVLYLRGISTGDFQDALAGRAGRTRWQDALAGRAGRTRWPPCSARTPRTCRRPFLAG